MHKSCRRRCCVWSNLYLIFLQDKKTAKRVAPSVKLASRLLWFLNERVAGILPTLYSSLTALLHSWQQAKPGKGLLSCWHKSQEIWAGCKQHQEQSRTFFQVQPVQESADPTNCLMWFPRKVSATVWTGTCQQFHQTMLDWHIREKVKNDSSWIRFLYLWVSWQMYRNNHSQLFERMSFCYGCCKVTQVTSLSLPC